MDGAQLLAGDIGGTNSRFALFDGQLKLLREKTYINQGRSSFGEVVKQFLEEFDAPVARISAATFGVAGPVRDGRVKLTNLSWELEERALEWELRINSVGLINDLRAHAEGIELLKPSDLIVVNASQQRAAGNRAIIAAGTGLGEAGLVWDEQKRWHHAVGCEGGHCDFAPQTDQEWALLSYLKSQNKPLSWESVLSGPGLRNIYDFLLTTPQFSSNVAVALSDPRPSRISEAAMDQSNQLCSHALELFITFYGSEAGNLALKYLATDGIYLGGGIAPKIAERIKSSQSFLNRFRTKGPEKIQKVLATIPIFIINCGTNALYGAANHARRMLGDSA